MSVNAARLKAWVRHAFSAIIIVGLVAYLWTHRGDIEAGMSISAGQLGLLVTLILVTWVLNSLPMLVFLRLMRKRVGFWENLSVSVAGGLANYLPMRIGTVIRMRYFKKAHDVDYSAFVGIMVVRTTLLLALTGVLGFCGLVGLGIAGESAPLAVWLGFAAMAVMSILVLLLPLPVPRTKTTFWRRVFGQLAVGQRALRENRLSFWLLVVILIGQFVVLSGRLFIAFQVFGLDVSVSVLLLLGPATTLITFLSITPGSLGVREWIIGALAAVTGLDFQSGLFAGTLDRSILLVLTFLIGPFCLYYTLRKTHSRCVAPAPE
jgi:glycosyltransferase 2 family protein